MKHEKNENLNLSFIEKDLGFVQTRGQALSITLFKSVKLKLSRKLDLIYSADLDTWYCIAYENV